MSDQPGSTPPGPGLPQDFGPQTPPPPPGYSQGGAPPSPTPPGPSPARPAGYVPPPQPPFPGQNAAWYYGPFPPAGTPQEGFGKSLAKTAARGCVASIAFAAGLALLPILMVVAFGACVAALQDSDAFDTGDTGASSNFVYGTEGADDRLLSIKIEGIILGEEPDGAPSIFDVIDATYGYEIKEQLREAQTRNDIKGVVLEISTPGGTIFGSRAIADAVKAYQAATRKPVYVYVQGLSASGGMYGMAPADKIYADHGSLIGSIGVILGTVPYYDGVIATEGGFLGGGVTTKNGIVFTTLTAGRSKDVFNPYRPMTDEEKRVLTQGLENEYDAFVKFVAAERDISESAIRDNYGALIFDNKGAEERKLIDGTRTREQVYEELAIAAGVSRFEVVREDDSPDFFGGLFGRLSDRILGRKEPARATGICFPANMSLAYYGDPAALCPLGKEK